MGFIVQFRRFQYKRTNNSPIRFSRHEFIHKRKLFSDRPGHRNKHAFRRFLFQKSPIPTELTPAPNQLDHNMEESNARILRQLSICWPAKIQPKKRNRRPIRSVPQTEHDDN